MHDTALHQANGKARAKYCPPNNESESTFDASKILVLPSRYVHRRLVADRCLALILLIVLAPFILAMMAMVRLTSRGPTIYRQIRVGLDGRTFMMYKLRTMRQDAEVGTGAVWAQPNDARITFVGRILRALHLDELPQLVNVIKGEMALIGPRPERPEFTQTLALRLPGYMQRHAARPGITGLAQVTLPPDSDLESVRRKLAVDLEYARYATVWLDTRILLATSLRLVGIRSGLFVDLLRLKTNHESGRPHQSPSTHRPAPKRLQPK